MYEQNLFKVVEPIKKTTISRLNKGKKWKYGYNKEQDLVVISRTGQIGDIYEIQNFKIALPKTTDVYSNKEKKWKQFEYPKELSRLKSIFDWKNYPEEKKAQWHDYINEEMTAFGLIIMGRIPTLLVLITCISNGVKLM
jgi:hypothetical protein